MKLFGDTGIEMIEPPSGENLYTNYLKADHESTDTYARQQKSIKMVNQLVPDSVSDIPEFNFSVIPDAKHEGLYNTQKAFEEINKPGRKGIAWDIEALGTSKRMALGKDKNADMFAITQVSLFEFDPTGKQPIDANEPVVVSMGISKRNASILKSEIDKLEKDPTYAKQMPEWKRRSIADLSLYDDESYFGKKKIGGKEISVMVGQSEDKPDLKGQALAYKENIARYRKGLRNMTNPELVNSENDAFEFINKTITNNHVLVAHNGEGYDIGNIIEVLKESSYEKKDELIKKYEKPAVDTLLVSKAVHNKNGFTAADNKLSSLVESLLPEQRSKFSAHYSGDDTVMTALLFSDEQKRIKQQKLFEPKETPFNKGQSFYVEQGISSYRPSAFNRNVGKHDITFRYSKDAKKYVPNYSFQEAPLIAGHKMQLNGFWDNVNIDDTNHFAVLMEDQTSQTQKLIFRESMTEINDLFSEHLVPEGKENQSRIRFAKEDRARRHYESLFEPTSFGKDQSIVKNLNDAYNTIDAYNDEIKILAPGQKKIDDNIKVQAMRNVRDKFNQGKDDSEPFLKSYDKIEKTIGAKERLESERGFWQNVINDAQEFNQPGGRKDLKMKQQNTFIRNMYEQLNENNPLGSDYKDQYGYKGMSRYKVPSRSNKGEFSYFNIESHKDFKKNLKNSVIGFGKNRGEIEKDLQNFMDTLGPNFDDKRKQEMMGFIRRDLQQNGKVKPGTLDHISKTLYTAATDNPDNIVSSIPGTSIKAAHGDYSSRINDYHNRLSSREDTLYKTMTEKASKEAKKRLSSSSMFERFNLDELSDPAKQKLKRAQSVVDSADEMVSHSQKIFGLNGQPKVDAIQKVNHQKNIEKVMKSFNDKGFNFSLDFGEEQDTMYLFFSHKNEKINLADMSFEDKLFGGKVQHLTMPVHTDDFLVNIQGTQLQDQLVAKVNGPIDLKNKQNNKMAIKRTSQVAYEGIENIPKRIERIMEEAKTEGRKISYSEASEKAISEYRGRMTRGRVAGAYRGMFGKTEGDQMGSLQKNIRGSFTVDTGDFIDEIFRQKEPESYQRFLEWKEEENLPFIRYAESNFVDNKRPGNIFNLKQQILNDSRKEWNKIFGEDSEYAMPVTPLGVNDSQYMTGRLNLVDPRKMTTLGTANPSTREQIHKPQNYHVMEENPIAEYLKEKHGEEAGSRMLNPIQSETALLYDDVEGIAKEKGLRGFQARTQFTNDDEIHQKVTSTIKDVESELAEKRSIKATGKKNKSLDMEIKNLERDLAELKSGKYSVYEEQILLPDNLLRSIQVTDDVNVMLKDGYKLNDTLRERIEKETGSDFSKGRHKFDKPINYKEMEKLGLIDKDGMLTVGDIIENSMFEEGMSNNNRTQSKRVYKESQIMGIEKMKNGDTRLMLRQSRRGQDGHKLIEAQGGTRATAIGVRESNWKRLFGKADVVRENIKDSRNPTGQMVSTLMQTSYENAMEELDSVIQKDATGRTVFNKENAKNPLIKKWAENAKDLSLSPEEMKRNFVKDTFIPEMDSTGYKGIIGLREKGKDGSLIQFNDIRDMKQFVGEKGHANFQKLYDKAKEFGFDEKNAISELRSHDVVSWQGSGTKATFAFREFGLIKQNLRHGKDGIKGEDDILYKALSKQTDKYAESAHNAYTSENIKALNVLRGSGKAKDYETAGNVLIDMTGSFSGDGNVQKRTNAAGDDFYVVNGFSIPKAKTDMKTKLDMEGTTSDLMSVRLYNSEDGLDGITIGDLIKDTNGQALVKIQDSEALGGRGPFSTDVVPVVSQFSSSFSEYETINQREINKKLENIFQEVQHYNDVDFSNSTLTKEEQMDRLNKIATNVNKNIREVPLEMDEYLTGKAKSGFVKGSKNLKAQKGVSSLVGMYNVNDTVRLPDGTFKGRGINEVYYSKDSVRHMIDGNEMNILKANSLEEVNGIPLDKLKKKDAQQYIYEKLEGPRKSDDDFRFIGITNRFPSQSEGSLNFSDVRIDPTMEKGSKRGMINRYLAKFLGADADGDVFYLTADLYSGEQSTKDLKLIQERMTNMADVTKAQLEELTEPAEMSTDTFSKIRNLDPVKDKGRIHELFNDFTGTDAEYLDTIAKSMKVPGIGYIDNEMVAARELLNKTYTAAFRSGSISREEFQKTFDNWNDVSDKFVQNFISAKKLKNDILDTPEMPFSEMGSNQKLNRVMEYIGKQNDIPGQIRNLNTDNIESLLDNFQSIGAMSSDNAERDTFREAFLPLAYSNEAIKEQNKKSLKIGRSKGTNATEILESIATSPETVIGTESVERLGNVAFGEDSDIMKNYARAQKAQQSKIADSLTNVKEKWSKTQGRESIINSFSDEIQDQVNISSNLARDSILKSKVTSQNKVYNELKNFGKETVNSTAFKAAAGFSAMWMLSAAIRKGPTPEGDNAEQEFASQAEVNPSALLTSPTARVTPNGENIHLSVSGKGNLNQSAIAGIINQEVSSMTGTPMDMNINLTDNTKNLDRGFYENTINRILGL